MMIAGDTAVLSAYKNQLPEKLYHYLEKVKALDFASLDDGRRDLDGKDYFSIETNPTEPAVMRRMEGHDKFIDIHYLVSGEEWIGVMPKHMSPGQKESYPERDLYFYEGEGEETKVLLKPGRFLVCFPEDLHRPLCAGPEGCLTVCKVVVKVALDGLK